MTPFIALYRKEFREHFGSLGLTLLFAFFLLLTPIWWLETRVVLVFYLITFYATITAAASYAGEDERQTSRFLRVMPVTGGTILRAKLSWLATSLLVLAWPLALGGYGILIGTGLDDGDRATFSNVFFGDIGRAVLFATSGLFCTISWAFFWTTRWPSKMFATFLAFASAYGSFIVCYIACVVVMVMTGNAELEGAPGTPLAVIIFLLTIIVSGITGLLSLRRAAGYYRLPETKTSGYYEPKAVENELRKPPRLLSRLYDRVFPAGHWRPCAALLWQSICQSGYILLFGLGMALIFSFWQIFFGQEFIEVANRSTENLYEGIVQFVSGVVILVGIMVAFGFASVMFSQDQENRNFRALTYRGVSPRLVWWSRVLPYAVVYLIPLPFVVRLFCDAVSVNPPADWEIYRVRMIGLVVTLYLAPLCLGAYYSIRFRHFVLSVLVVFGVWFLLFTVVLILVTEKSPPPILVFISVLLGYLLASRVMIGDWLREKPFSRFWWKPVSAMAICLFVSLSIFACDLYFRH